MEFRQLSTECIKKEGDTLLVVVFFGIDRVEVDAHGVVFVDDPVEGPREGVIDRDEEEEHPAGMPERPSPGIEARGDAEADIDRDDEDWQGEGAEALLADAFDDGPKDDRVEEGDPPDGPAGPVLGPEEAKQDVDDDRAEEEDRPKDFLDDLEARLLLFLDAHPVEADVDVIPFLGVVDGDALRGDVHLGPIFAFDMDP